MSGQDRYPLDPPRLLIELADSPLPERIEQVVDGVAKLTERVKSILNQDFLVLPDRLHDFDGFRRGLVAIRERRVPTEDELAVLSHPHGMLEDLRYALNHLADPEVVFTPELLPSEREACGVIHMLLRRALENFPDLIAYMHVGGWRTSIRHEQDDEPNLLL